jgi:hypothetical protein
MNWGLAGRDQFENDHSVVAAGAVDDAVGAGAICTGAAAAGVRFGVGGFLAAASAGEAAAVVADGGRGAGTGASWTGPAAGGVRPAGALPGSGTMMLTGGVEAADGNSALVGLPVGTDVVGSAATSPGAAAGGGAFQDDA